MLAHAPTDLQTRLPYYSFRRCHLSSSDSQNGWYWTAHVVFPYKIREDILDQVLGKGKAPKQAEGVLDDFTIYHKQTEGC